jgi:hypothetical protein
MPCPVHVNPLTSASLLTYVFQPFENIPSPAVKMLETASDHEAVGTREKLGQGTIRSPGDDSSPGEGEGEGTGLSKKGTISV